MASIFTYMLVCVLQTDRPLFETVAFLWHHSPSAGASAGCPFGPLAPPVRCHLQLLLKTVGGHALLLHTHARADTKTDSQSVVVWALLCSLDFHVAYSSFLHDLFFKSDFPLSLGFVSMFWFCWFNLDFIMFFVVFFVCIFLCISYYHDLFLANFTSFFIL